MKNTIDPTGFASRQQLIYLNRFNPMAKRLAALKREDRNLGIEAERYSARMLKQAVRETRADLGKDFPKFTGPNV